MPPTRAGRSLRQLEAGELANSWCREQSINRHFALPSFELAGTRSSDDVHSDVRANRICRFDCDGFGDHLATGAQVAWQTDVVAGTWIEVQNAAFLSSAIQSVGGKGFN